MRRPDPNVELAVVSNGLPEVGGRSDGGYQIILDELLTGLPQNRVVYAGMGRSRAGSEAPVLHVPWFRTPQGRVEATLAAVSMASWAKWGARALPIAFPNVRRILATVDPMLPLAVSWAEASGAELWVYAIDLHLGGFWGASKRFTPLLERSCERAWKRASRAFALSPGLAGWLEREGVRCPIEVLPPLIHVGDAVPLPAARPVKLVYAGSVYVANERLLDWLGRAARELGPEIELDLVTSNARRYVERRIDLRPWRLSGGTRESVIDAVKASTWTIIAVEPRALNHYIQYSWPTKLREYLSVGRPVLCITGRDYDVAKLAREGGWGIVATDEAETRAALRRVLGEDRTTLEQRAAAAHAFARERMNNGVLGEDWRRRALA